MPCFEILGVFLKKFRGTSLRAFYEIFCGFPDMNVIKFGLEEIRRHEFLKDKSTFFWWLGWGGGAFVCACVCSVLMGISPWDW